jgi:hypothetical protein
MATKTDTSVWTWGDDSDFELAFASNTPRLAPGQAFSMPSAQDISAGRFFTTSLEFGIINVCGYNGDGELGRPSPPLTVNSPTTLDNASDWTAVSAGFMNTIALKSDGTVWACGRNAEGELANGTNGSIYSLQKVLRTATLALSSLSQSYDGTAKTVSVTTTPSSLNVSVTYNGLSTPPVNAGTYTVSVVTSDAEPSADFYGQTTGTLVIAQAVAPVVLSKLVQYYDGTAKSVSATTVPSGLVVDITYNGSLNAPTNAGTYPVVATINDANYQGSASNNLVIAPLPTALAKGTYTGLFFQSNNVTLDSSGYFTLTLDAKEKIGGSILIDGGRYGLSGHFNTNTASTNISVIRTGTNTLTVSLQLSSDGTSGMVSGTVSDGVWTATLFGNKNYYSPTNLCPLAGNYAMTLDGLGDGTSAPNVGTRGIIKVKSNGTISLAGQFADDAALAQAAVLSKTGQWPFYMKLYKGAGSALGWITFTNSADSKLGGSVSWIKTGSFGTFYSAGFTNVMTAHGTIRQ